MSFKMQMFFRDGGLTAAIVGGAAAIAGTGMNAYSTGKTNRKTRKWQEHMYSKSNDTNIANWQMQNEYNLPINQMKRFKEAGLNPNLIYGSGTDARAGNIDNPAMASGEVHAPQIDPEVIGRSVGSVYDVKVKQAQIDNMRVQKENIVQDTDLKSAQEIATLKNAGYTDQQITALQQEIEQRRLLNPISLDAAVAGVEKTKADTAYTIDSMNRANIQLIDHLKNTSLGRVKTREEIAHIAQQITNLVSQNKITEYEAYLADLGLSKSDNVIFRMLGTWNRGRGADNSNPPRQGVKKIFRGSIPKRK